MVEGLSCGRDASNKDDYCDSNQLPRHISFPYGPTAPSGPRPPHYRVFTITLRYTTVGRTPLDEGSSRRRDLYLTAHTTHKRQISMHNVGFEPTIPESERPQNDALDRAATRIGTNL
jgi:hypothetical protein